MVLTTGSGDKATSDESQRPSSGEPQSSEHLVDGRSFDGELQLHFYNKHLALSHQEALKSEQASMFAIISVFIIARNSSSATTPGSELDFILDNLNLIESQGMAIDLELNRHLINSLMIEQSDYITYQGSLNRPPCHENADWILLNRAHLVELEKFQLLFQSGATTTNQDNVRPVNPTHKRLLRTTINNRPRGKLRQEPMQVQLEAINCSTSNGTKVSSGGLF